MVEKQFLTMMSQDESVKNVIETETGSRKIEETVISPGNLTFVINCKDIQNTEKLNNVVKKGQLENVIRKILGKHVSQPASIGTVDVGLDRVAYDQHMMHLHGTKLG